MKHFWLFIFLAVLQGLTEPLPVSSSGHLALAQIVSNTPLEDLTLEILLHGGSLIAIVVFYYNDIKQLVLDNIAYLFKKDTTKKPAWDYFLKLIIATIPAGIAGLLFEDFFTQAFANPKFIGVGLLITTGLLVLTRYKSKSNKQPVSFKQAFIIGLSQIVALFPGVSRSGTTTSTGMVNRLDQEEALKFSFFMFIPIASLVLVRGISDVIQMENLSHYAFSYTIAVIVSGVVTYFSLFMLRRIVRERIYHYFAFYTLLIGLIAIFIL